MSEVTEYQQVAALLAMDIDILATVAEDNSHDANFLQAMIFRLKKNKDLLITDDKHREMRYNATAKVFNVASKE